MAKKTKKQKSNDCRLCCEDPVEDDHYTRQIITRIDEITALEEYIELIHDEIYALARQSIRFNDCDQLIIEGTCPCCKEARYKKLFISTLYIKHCVNCGWIDVCKAEVIK